MNHTSKECHLCHRLGHRGFVPWGSEGWECANDRACRGRAEARARAGSGGTPDETGHHA